MARYWCIAIRGVVGGKENKNSHMNEVRLEPGFFVSCMADRKHP